MRNHSPWAICFCSSSLAVGIGGMKPMICQPFQTIPSPMSVEVKAAPKETNLQGWLRNVPKQKFIGECVCGGPVTTDEMDDENESICCKQKGSETS